MWQGLSTAVDTYVTPPAWVDVLGNTLFGKDIRPGAYDLVQNLKTNDPLTAVTKLARDTTEERLPANQRAGDSSLLNTDGKQLQGIMGSLFGLGANAWSSFMNFGDREATGMQAEGVWKDLKQNFMDMNPLGNSVWGNSIKGSIRTPVEESVSRALPNIKDTVGASGDMMSDGFTRRGGPPTLTRGDKKVPTDPVMQDIYRTVGHFDVPLSRLQQRVNDLKRQLEDSNRGGFLPQQTRENRNEIIKKMQATYGDMDAIILDLNDTISRKIGKPFDIRRRPDWGGTVDQF